MDQRRYSNEKESKTPIAVSNVLKKAGKRNSVALRASSTMQVRQNDQEAQDLILAIEQDDLSIQNL